jgi:hypothetical protein
LSVINAITGIVRRISWKVVRPVGIMIPHLFRAGS